MAYTYEEAVKKFGELTEFEPLSQGDIMQWSSPVGVKGTVLFSFDKGEHIYCVFGGGKNELTQKQIAIFRRENKLMCDIYLENKMGK